MPIGQWARRRAGIKASAIEALRDGQGERAAAAHTGLPLATVHGVRTFYQLLGDADRRACTGTACSYARGFAAPGGAEVHCVGRCYEAPCTLEAGEFPIPVSSLVDEPVVLRRVLGASESLEELFALPPGERILEILEGSGLRGRGGAAFPTGAKWRAAADTPAEVRYVVANGDEGDPGSYADRLLLERDPHSVLAGMNACAAAIGAARGIVYVRGEYPRAAEVVREAIEAARPHLVPGFEITVHVGAGSYVCGEETALLRGIEGLRAEPRPRPPYPVQVGLDGKPTVVQNVETLAVVPWVLRAGRRPGTKAFSLSGAVKTPGAVEAAFGTPLRTLLERGGGGPPAGLRWKMALVGGPMGCVVPEAELDRPLTFSAMPAMGHGGIVVLDESVSARTLAEHLFRFAASESCGTCTPCRAGTAQLSRVRDGAALTRLLDTIEGGSLCGFGLAVPRPIRDLLAHFPDEMFPKESP
jgi:NADH:ubiquinone oxidoreductase subunit F (NADH-binding)